MQKNLALESTTAVIPHPRVKPRLASQDLNITIEKVGTIW